MDRHHAQSYLEALHPEGSTEVVSRAVHISGVRSNVPSQSRAQDDPTPSELRVCVAEMGDVPSSRDEDDTQDHALGGYCNSNIDLADQPKHLPKAVSSLTHEDLILFRP